MLPAGTSNAPPHLGARWPMRDRGQQLSALSLLRALPLQSKAQRTVLRGAASVDEDVRKLSTSVGLLRHTGESGTVLPHSARASISRVAGGLLAIGAHLR